MADAIKRYSYLLGQTDLFRHFVDMKARTLVSTTRLLTFLYIVNRGLVIPSMRR